MQTLASMSALAAALMTSSLVCADDIAKDQAMNVVRNGEQASIQGAPSNFVGNARIDPLFPARAPSKVSAGAVTFQPGARSMWHTHPLG